MTHTLKHIDFEPPDWAEFASGPSLQLGYVNQVLSDSPAGYWRLGESAGSTTAIDFSGNASHGTYVGASTLGQPGALATDSDASVRLPGLLGNYVDTPLTSVAGEPATFEAWVNIPAALSTDSAILGQTIVPGDAGSTIFTVRTSLVLRVYISSTSLQDNVPLSLNTWHHVAFTYSGSPDGDYQFYLDGAATSSGTLANNPSEGTFVIGVHNKLTFNPFNGFIDEVAIYASALSADRVLAHYNAGVGR